MKSHLYQYFNLTSKIDNFYLKNKSWISWNDSRDFSRTIRVLWRASNYSFLSFLKLANSNIPTFHNLPNTDCKLDRLSSRHAIVENLTAQESPSIVNFHFASFWDDLSSAWSQWFYNEFPLLINNIFRICFWFIFVFIQRLFHGTFIWLCKSLRLFEKILKLLRILRKTGELINQVPIKDHVSLRDRLQL